MQMKRLTRLLNAIGISTKDGTMVTECCCLACLSLCLQVPAGRDWRDWFFGKLENASMFMPLQSAAFMASAACKLEVDRAEELKKPTLCVMLDHQGCQSSPDKDKFPKYSKLQTVPAAGSDFEDNFWANFIHLVNKCKIHLKKSDELHGVIIFSEYSALQLDKQLAEWLQEQLKQVGFNIKICSTDSAWEHNKDEYDKAAVLLPMLSQHF